MFSASVSNFRTYGPTTLALLLIAFLAAVLIDRRLLTPRMARPAAAGQAVAAADPEPLPDLRRIVLDPCTGLEKTALAMQAAKFD